MPTATSTTLATPELLEAVLLHLPPHDLLATAPLVSHSFHNAIRSSTSIQQALFLRPRIRPQSSAEWTLNPLLQTAFPPFFNLRIIGGFFNSPSDADFRCLDWNKSPARRRAYKRKGASWRRMLVVQPPIVTLRVEEIVCGPGGYSERQGCLVVEDGLRMGVLYDLVQKRVGVPISGFWVRWRMFLTNREDRSEPKSMEDEGDGDSEERSEEAGDVQRECVQDEWRQGVTLVLQNTVQCCIGMPNTVGPEFESEDYEDTKVEFGEWRHGTE